jgi:hypothetical protein
VWAAITSIQSPSVNALAILSSMTTGLLVAATALLSSAVTGIVSLLVVSRSHRLDLEAADRTRTIAAYEEFTNAAGRFLVRSGDLALARRKPSPPSRSEADSALINQLRDAVLNDKFALLDALGRVDFEGSPAADGVANRLVDQCLKLSHLAPEKVGTGAHEELVNQASKTRDEFVGVSQREVGLPFSGRETRATAAPLRWPRMTISRSWRRR